MPQGFNVTDFRTGSTAHRLVAADRFSLSFVFDIPGDRVQRHRPPVMAFQHVPTLQSTGRLLSTPPSTWFSRMLARAYFSLTTIGPTCPTTLRPLNRGKIDVCIRCALYAIWDLSPPLPVASFRSDCRIVVILCLRVCLVCVLLQSITTDSARLLSFRRPNRGDIVSFGFVQRVPPLLPPPIPSASIHSLNRGYIVIPVAFVPY